MLIYLQSAYIPTVQTTYGLYTEHKVYDSGQSKKSPRECFTSPKTALKSITLEICDMGLCGMLVMAILL